jgi:hypothetical protein
MLTMVDKPKIFTVAGGEIPDRSYKNWFEMAFNLYKLLYDQPPGLAVQRSIMEEPRRYALGFYKVLVTGQWDEDDALELRDLLITNMEGDLRYGK